MLNTLSDNIRIVYFVVGEVFIWNGKKISENLYGIEVVMNNTHFNQTPITYIYNILLHTLIMQTNLTTALNKTSPPQLPSTPLTPPVSGATLSAVGNFCIGLGFQIQKLAHTYPKPRHIMQCGICLMIFGEGCNFTAYGIAPASVVAPLDAVAIMSNVLLSKILFKDRISRAGLVGILITALGTSTVILNAPTITTHYEHDYFFPRNHAAFVFYSILSFRALVWFISAIAAVLWMINPYDSTLAVSRHAKRFNPFFYCFICASMGTFTAVSGKCISSAMHHALRNKSTAMFNDPDVCWLTYLMIAFCIGSIMLQMKYLGIALSYFNPGKVITLYYIMFSSFTVAAGMIIFNETFFDTGHFVELFVVGLLVTYAGVFAIGSDTPYNPKVFHVEPEYRVLTSVVRIEDYALV